jgi:hypothetical protein
MVRLVVFGASYIFMAGSLLLSAIITMIAVKTPDTNHKTDLSGQAKLCQPAIYPLTLARGLSKLKYHHERTTKGSTNPPSFTGG